MIVDFKARLFCRSANVPRREIDPSDPLWRDRIERGLIGQYGLPPAEDPSEYAAAFEAVFPLEAERRDYIEQAVRKGSPSFGHRVLAALIAAGQVPCLFTTNFDPLIERSTTVADELQQPENQAHLAVAALDSVERARRCLRESAWPLLVKLHGDYQSDDLKNTEAELQGQDADLRNVLIEACGRFGLIVVGYSGRDASIMSALTEALDRNDPYPAGIRWVRRSEGSPLPAVVEFMDLAVQRGVDARWLRAETFDELAADIDTQISLPLVLAEHVKGNRPPRVVQQTSVPLEGDFPVIRLSALPVLALPDRARRIQLQSPLSAGAARSLLKADSARGIVTTRGSAILAFGADHDLLKAFGASIPKLDGEELLTPDVDSLHLGLIYDALVQALARRRPLRPVLKRRGHSIVVAGSRSQRTPDQVRRDQASLAKLKAAYASDLVGTVPGTDLAYAEGIKLRLEHHDDRWWCVFDPYTWVDLPLTAGRGEMNAATDDSRGLLHPSGPAADWRRERWAERRNKWWAGAIDAWSDLLVGDREAELSVPWLPDQPGICAQFKVSGSTAWSRPLRSDREVDR